jgi:hypothetical protein
MFLSYYIFKNIVSSVVVVEKLRGKDKIIQTGIVLSRETVVGLEGSAIKRRTITEHHVNGSALVARGLHLIYFFHTSTLGTGTIIFTDMIVIIRMVL